MKQFKLTLALIIALQINAQKSANVYYVELIEDQKIEANPVKEFPEKNIMKDDPKIYKAYAKYFSKYVKAYAKEGITVDKIVIQNEQAKVVDIPAHTISVVEIKK